MSDDNLPVHNKSDDNSNDEDNDGSDNDDTSCVATTESDRVNARVLHEMHCLSGWFNPIANEVIDKAKAAEEETSNKGDNATHQSGREVANAMIVAKPLCILHKRRSD